MDQQVLSTLIGQIIQYLGGLDWSFIITFILIGYFFNTRRVRNQFVKIGKIRIRTRYRMAIVGILYSIVLFIIRGSTLGDIERLSTSFTFALVFHKLMIDRLVNFLSKRLNLNPTHGSNDINLPRNGQNRS